jgi:hypothetical protein
MFVAKKPATSFSTRGIEFRDGGKKLRFTSPHLAPRSDAIFTEVNLVSTFFFFRVCGFSQGDGISRENGRRMKPPRTKCILWSVCFLSRFIFFFSTSSFYVYRGDSRRPANSTASLAAAAAVTATALVSPATKEHGGNTVLWLGSFFTFPFLCTQAAAWANICPRHHQTRYFSQSRFFFLLPSAGISV